jgi:hypothetical protein
LHRSIVRLRRGMILRIESQRCQNCFGPGSLCRARQRATCLRRKWDSDLRWTFRLDVSVRGLWKRRAYKSHVRRQRRETHRRQP